MGIEFVRKAASSYTKAIDRERVRLHVRPTLPMRLGRSHPDDRD